MISPADLHKQIHWFTFGVLHMQPCYGELSIDSTCWSHWCLQGKGWDVCYCVSVCQSGNFPLDRARQPGATGEIQSSRRQGGPDLAGHIKTSLFNSSCPGENKLTPWCGAPHACPPPYIVTGRVVCHMGELTAWPRLNHLIGRVIACSGCMCVRGTEFGSEDGLVSLASWTGKWLACTSLLAWNVVIQHGRLFIFFTKKMVNLCGVLSV